MVESEEDGTFCGAVDAVELHRLDVRNVIGFCSNSPV